MTKEKMSEIRDRWLRMENYTHVRDVFLDNDYLRKSTMMDHTGFNKEDANSLLKFLSRNFLITDTSQGVRKTPMFTAWLKSFRDDDNTEPPF